MIDIKSNFPSEKKESQTHQVVFMSTYWTLPLKILYSIVVSCIFVLPALIGYALRIEITRKSFWVLGVYGTVVFVFIFLQLIFATLNRVMVCHYRRKSPPAFSRDHDLRDEKTNDEQLDITSETTCAEDQEKGQEQGRPATRMGLAVVGYREEPELFMQCLESVKNLNYPDPFKVIVVIDGDAPDDKEMAVLFQKTFPQSPILVLPELLSVSFEKLRSQQEKVNYDQLLQETFTLPTDTTPVCYMQPHRGKRHAMYTAFRILMASGCDAVMSTDSDTRFDPDAMIEMERALYWFPNIGAVAGDVRIWNARDSLLSFMSSLRYWMAFNIERAAQSFNRCVTCVSGPMGIYRSYVLREILDDWIGQSFLGMECTYGDDRHLTNRTLLHGYRVVYTHLAFCETETPISFLRWFKQQTRWSKSFYRELLWNARSLHKHSPWMAAELFYQGIYPFVLLFSIFQILFSKSPFVLVIWLISLLVIACIKTVYSTLVTLQVRFLAFPIYSLYYMFGLVPAKLWAIISLWDVGWGTSARSAAERKRENVFWSQLKEALPIIAWLILLLGGVAFNVVIYMINPDKINGFDFFGFNSGNVPDPESIVFYPNMNRSPVKS
ncbi:nucleotide-diphospho-sugar transferase [Gilbertella persicaria]|uniref:Hyaluronan synthase n=1 Tax=Rhizopus stolonifer TaxID=4846 RepID=A0A367KRS6_RHIST|nr:nucleotide-diphospho-sugar transferase [Gilbertella persicaria]KAI8092261.1 nucleotide-diphospho-sugar transferase [Gilbertella persicaria]RCI04840.1 hyaluronan synthase [Rhizopus stolonifer]